MNPKRVTNIGIKYRLCHFASKFNKAFTPMYKNIYPDSNNADYIIEQYPV